MIKKLLTTVALFSLTAGISGCSKEPEPVDPETQAQISRGEMLFKQNCSKCHEAGGRGDYLKRIPATLLTRRSASELASWIEGRDQHREMPNFTNLTEEERYALAEFLFDRVLGPR